MSEAPKPSYTAEPIRRDVISLGKTRAQRTAELLAGLRAELDPKPEHRALSRMSGRLIARMLLSLARDSKTRLSFILVRADVMLELLRRSTPTTYERIFDVAAGFAPMGWQMAQAHPEAEVIEIDMPDVVKEKELRLQRASLPIPPNLSWRGADLGVTPLAEVVEGKQADAMLVAGLFSYFKPDEVRTITTNLAACLKPGGVCISDIAWKPQIDTAPNRAGVSFYRGRASEFKTELHTEADAAGLFPAFAEVKVYRCSEIAAEMGRTEKVTDYALIVVARKAN